MMTVKKWKLGVPLTLCLGRGDQGELTSKKKIGGCPGRPGPNLPRSGIGRPRKSQILLIGINSPLETDLILLNLLFMGAGK